ncbi:DUF3052 domain-containing protein [Actinokineospora bangkokensis]|uniref:DUF3052 domain-containing protein n=1 Tax=Actinokineospora bangkokensis TaxID=1193682 RepID=A0A1Q9LTN4_9PSEU|nr:DUF3052 domain-containing protein [Actinokineospora bangkokensis]OLR95396.1 hypothetical protein BJP25_06490 [Actinokineospora bangkokensis]
MSDTELAARLDLSAGQVVLEIGWDEDADDDLRASIEAVIEGDLVDEDYDDVADVVLLWARDEDGDLTDALMDASSPLDDGGVIWLLTPKTARPGHIEPSDVSEAAKTAGLTLNKPVAISSDWTAMKLVPPKR